jgi:hypothetical protein
MVLPENEYFFLTTSKNNFFIENLRKFVTIQQFSKNHL